jgi:ABC-type nitrate/sulfonate/bicarbonate transport system substrate-binding protein
VIVGGHLNRQMFNLVTRKDIRKAEDLRGKKIGVASLAGTNAVAVRLVLKEWKIPLEAVNLLVVGGSPTQLAGLESGTIDAAVLTYGVTTEALRRGMTVLADLSKPVPEFPDRTIITRRSFLMKERNHIKAFMQALSEAIYQIKTADNRRREELIAIAGKHLRVGPAVAREFYSLYENAFSYPPRVGRKGMAAVMELIQEETGRPKAEFEVSRFLDERILDELENEGFFKKLESEYARR